MSNDVAAPKAGAVAIPEDWKKTLAGYAEAAREAEKLAGTFFSTKGGILSFGGVAVPNNTMDVICIGSLHENVYYKEAFGAQVQAPNCYAFSETGDASMAPDPQEVAEPQSGTCNACPQNKWGSDSQGGKGKACKNMRRLALMPESALASAEEITKATVGYLRVPVTSVKNWGAHVQNMAARGLPPFALVTRVRVVPDAKTMFKIEFAIAQSITNTDILLALEERWNNEKKVIDFPYPQRDDAQANGSIDATNPPKGKF